MRTEPKIRAAIARLQQMLQTIRDGRHTMSQLEFTAAIGTGGASLEALRWALGEDDDNPFTTLIEKP